MAADRIEDPESASAEMDAAPRSARVRMPRRRASARAARPGGESEEWMMTYMDTVTLLVTLFVLLFSFSTINPEKYALVAEGLSLNKYGSGIMTGVAIPRGRVGEPAVSAPPPTAAPKISAAEPTPPDSSTAEQNADAVALLRDALSDQGLGDRVDVKITDNLIDLQLRDSVLFDSGAAELTEAGTDALSRLIPLLSRSSFSISVEGHTDSVPISTGTFASNWELSGARAAAVVRKLIELGIAADRLRMVGYAHTHPIAGNDTVEGRRHNRRVNLILNVAPGDAAHVLSDRKQ